jgi:hypothetical protein
VLADRVRAAWNASGAPVTQWVVEARPGQVIVVDDTDRTFRRVPVLASGDQIVFGEPEPYDPETDKTVVFASRAESRPDAGLITPTDPTPPEPPAEPEPAPQPQEPPAAEPDNPTEPKEDLVSTLTADARQWLNLPEDTSDDDVAAAVKQRLTAPTEPDPEPKPTQPDPELVAAAAANEDLSKQVELLSQQVATLSQQVANANAEKAATVKASVLEEATQLGKIAPDPKVQAEWAKDYDDAPAAVTRVLASIAPGTAVPVMASGHTGPAEPTGDLDAEWAQVSHVFPPETAGTGA